MKNLILILLLAGSTLLAGCGGSQGDFVLAGTNNTPATDTPIARNDTYTASQDTSISTPAGQGVLVNDILNINSVTDIFVNYPNITNRGGTLSLANSTGAFTYTPPVGFVGTDSFAYTLSNGVGTSSATVAITVASAPVRTGFFVDSANGDDTNGSFATGAAFQTIQGAVNAAPANTDIVVRPGKYNGAVTLKNGQKLLGSGSGLVTAQGDLRPVLSGPVNLADGNRLDFLRIVGTAGDAVVGTGRNGGTVTNCEIANTTSNGSGINASSGFGTWTISDNTITNVTAIGVELRSAATGTMTARVNNNTITGSSLGAIGLLATGSSNFKAQVQDNTMNGNIRESAFEAIAGNSATMSLDIQNNVNDDVYRFDRGDTTATLNVEQFAQLSEINQSGTVVVSLVSQPITDVSNGFCGF